MTRSTPDAPTRLVEVARATLERASAQLLEHRALLLEARIALGEHPSAPSDLDLRSIGTQLIRADDQLLAALSSLRAAVREAGYP